MRTSALLMGNDLSLTYTDIKYRLTPESENQCFTASQNVLRKSFSKFHCPTYSLIFVD